MKNLVLRNLLSNAIKFTPEKGTISIGVHEHPSFIEIYVKDSGMGMSHEALAKIRNNDYFTTKGTASESGTGLGLMLCKEFLVKMAGNYISKANRVKAVHSHFLFQNHFKELQ